MLMGCGATLIVIEKKNYWYMNVYILQCNATRVAT